MSENMIDGAVALLVALVVVSAGIGVFVGFSSGLENGRMEICREVGFTTEICKKLENEKLGIETEDGNSTNN